VAAAADFPSLCWCWGGVLSGLYQAETKQETEKARTEFTAALVGLVVVFCCLGNCATVGHLLRG